MMTAVAGKIGAATVTAALAVTTVLSGCGNGHEGTAFSGEPVTGGAVGQVGSMQVRNAKFASTDSAADGVEYRPGQDVIVQVSIVNNRTTTQPGGRAPDTLIGVSSPIARSGRINGDARIGAGQVLTSGYDDPTASGVGPDSRTLTISLIGLTEPLRAGMSYPVVFTFARAGALRVEVPVENPAASPAGTVPESHSAGSQSSGPALPVPVPR